MSERGYLFFCICKPNNNKNKKLESGITWIRVFCRYRQNILFDLDLFSLENKYILEYNEDEQDK